MTTVKPPAVAGLFYPSDPNELRSTVDAMLGKAEKSADAPTGYPKVIMAPHAGYVYSGQIAANAHHLLDPKTKRVLIIGPTHRVGIEGMALTGADIQRTPLGDIPTDPELTAILEAHPDVITAPVVHAQEHSIEVHLPFLQRHLEGPFTVVPLAVGRVDAKAVAEVIEVAAVRPDTAVVVSSDMSHFLPKSRAKAVDGGTVRQILSGEPVTPDQACGAYSVNGMTQYAVDAGLKAQPIAVGDSGDVSGDTSSVVGYASLAWYPLEDRDPAEAADEDVQVSEKSEDLGSLLTWMAHATLAQALGEEELPEPSVDFDEQLRDVGACFVTLEKNGRLRGCIGSLEPTRSLAEDVVQNALAAAFRDPRFPQLSADELRDVDIEVSVLGRPRPLQNEGDSPLTERFVLESLKPGEDGVIFEWGPHRATFLPQVWEQLPEPQEFLNQLKAKAGLPADFWADDVEVQTYPVTAYSRSAESRA